MLGARLRAYPAVTDVKNADRISERPAPASAPRRRRPMQVVGGAGELAADNTSPLLNGSE